MTDQKIGFIGQGFIGRHMADDFAERGFSIVRYALEPEFAGNLKGISTCDIVFVAVPTPTTPSGFDSSILESVISIAGAGKIVVIKSTMLPGTTARLQALFPDRIILHSPEFLREKTAREDTQSPQRNIIGLPVSDDVHKQAAETVMKLLPQSPFSMITGAYEAEMIKYAGNNFLALKVVFMNIIYDAASAVGANYTDIIEAMQADPRIGNSHMNVVDQSGHPGSVPGRGAGGHCFPKDWAAFTDWYENTCPDDKVGIATLKAVEEKNKTLLRDSNKDLDILAGIYGA